MELDRVPLWRGDHVEVRQLVEDFAKYVYLPRLKDPSVLLGAVADGVALLTWEQDAFAYADGYDEATGRYRGLRAGQQVQLSAAEPKGLAVKPEVARRQLDTETRSGGQLTPTPLPGGDLQRVSPPPPKTVLPHRFHGAVDLNPLRAGADAGRIAQEVIAHLAGLPGAQIRVTLEIEAEVPGGVPEQVVRTVTENCRTLKFTNHGFEKE